MRDAIIIMILLIILFVVLTIPFDSRFQGEKLEALIEELHENDEYIKRQLMELDGDITRLIEKFIEYIETREE